MRTVAVVGSGAAGLSAALAARLGGAEVTVYERGEKVGGTTALSGGNGWFPANRFLPDDTPELALKYLRAISLGDANDELLQVFVARGVDRGRLHRGQHGAASGSRSPTRDYHAHLEGGREQGGRTLEPQPLLPTPRVADLLRDAPNVSAPITYAELAGGDIDRDALRARMEQGIVSMGRALLAALLEACLEAGVTVRTGVRVSRCPRPTRSMLATGGFERDPELAKAFLRGPLLAPVGAPTAEGDGLRMAMGAGAALGNMSEAWWCPAYMLPGETIDGAPMARLILTERARPGSLIVDSQRQALHRRGPELQRLRAHDAQLRGDVVLVPARARVARVRRRLPRALPARPARPPRPRSGVAGARRDAGASWRRRSACRPTRWRTTIERFNDGARARRGPGLRPRLVPL